MTQFQPFLDRAYARKGEALDSQLDQYLTPPLSAEELTETPDDRWLSSIAKGVFAAGFRWRVVEAKWPDFEQAFLGFDPRVVADLSAAAEAGLAQDRRVIRNPQKIRSTIENAAFVQRVSAQHRGFGRFIAQWPDDDVVGLWAFLKKEGSRLGGDTGPRLLRRMGKDTFILTADVTYALTEAGIMTGKATSKRGRNEAQAAFSRWRESTGKSYGELSMICAMSVDRPD